jgi:hypothetical protein
MMTTHKQDQSALSYTRWRGPLTDGAKAPIRQRLNESVVGRLSPQNRHYLSKGDEEMKHAYIVEVWETVCTEHRVIAESEQDARENWAALSSYERELPNERFVDQVKVTYDGEIAQ